MRAIVLPDYGPASALRLQTLPDPTPGPGEIAIRVAAAGINPIDWKQRSGNYKAFMPLTFPAVLGRDVSGTVLSVGSGVTAFTAGARVMGRVPRGGYAEIAVGPAASFTIVPAKLDLADAAALPLALLTGSQLAEEAVDARNGEVVLVTGATGSVGRVAVFTAKARGARVYAGVRARIKGDAAKLAVGGVVALDDDAEIAGLPALDGIADTVGGPTTQKLLEKVKRGGRIGSVVGPTPGAADRGITVRPIVTHDDPQRFAELAQAVADGKLIIPIVRRFPLAQAAEATALAEAGAGGKVLLIP